MRKSQELNIKMSEARSKLNAAIEKRNEAGEMTDELRTEMRSATTALEDLEIEYRAALHAEAKEDKQAALNEPDAEQREFKKIEKRAEFGNYVVAAIENRAVDGAEKELNEAVGLAGNHFPLSKLDENNDAEIEKRAKIDGDTATRPNTWLDRLFYGSAAQRLGIQFPSVAAGVSSYPVTTGGPTGAQRGREQAATDGTFTYSITELKPTRHALSMTYSIEDAARVPGLADAIQRDMREAMVESIDTAIFKGDDGASENAADISGLETASIGESTLTQAQKDKPASIISMFADMVDGKFAEGLTDLNVVASVGTYRLWLKTIANANADNSTVSRFLRENGISYLTRGGIDTATTNGKFGGFVSLSRGLSGAGVAPVWMGAELITDRYTGAKKGEVVLTLSYLWNFGIPRTDNFKRIKYVS